MGGVENLSCFLMLYWWSWSVSPFLALMQGGQFLTDFAPLCRITCTDQSEYTVYRWGPAGRSPSVSEAFIPLRRVVVIALTHCRLSSCIRGRLLEVNENILERPALLLEKVNTCSYAFFLVVFKCACRHFNWHLWILMLIGVLGVPLLS